MTNLENLKALREKTGAGILDCKKALLSSDNNLEKAIAFIKAQGAEIVNKKQNKATQCGMIASYVHINFKVGVLLELRCETDFVGRHSDFADLAKALCIQIASSPDGDVVYDSTKENLGADKDSFLKESLLSLPFFRDPSISVADFLASYVSSFKENIKIFRYTKYSLS